MPTEPVTAAGWRIEPPVSEPSASGASNAATAAAEPPPEPPGMRVEVPRVVRRAVRGVLGRRAHRELVHVGLAERHQAGRAHPGDDRRVVRRDPALEDLRPGGRRHAEGAEHVLDRDRHAGERAELARRPRAARRSRRRSSRAAAFRCRNAWMSPSTAAMRSRCAWVASTLETSPDASCAASSAASR